MAPWGLRKLLNWIKNTCQPNLPIYITVSGCSDGANRGLQGHFDAARVMPFHDYLSEVSKAITAFRRMNLKVSSLTSVCMLGPVLAVQGGRYRPWRLTHGPPAAVH